MLPFGPADALMLKLLMPITPVLIVLEQFSDVVTCTMYSVAWVCVTPVGFWLDELKPDGKEVQVKFNGSGVPLIMISSIAQ